MLELLFNYIRAILARKSWLLSSNNLLPVFGGELIISSLFGGELIISSLFGGELMKSVSSAIMEDNISSAEDIITRWDLNTSNYAKITSLFYHSRDEAHYFLRAVSDLKTAMHYFLSSGDSHSKLLRRAQHLMTSAMARLQKEFYQILAANRNRLDSESLSSVSSVSTDDGNASEDDDPVEDNRLKATAAMDDLRSIAECMVKCGHTKECVKIYTTVRRSIVDEGLFRLGHIRKSSTQVQKLDWEEAKDCVRSWVAGSRSAIRTLFAGERFLCDYVFGTDVKEYIFSEVAKEPAVQFLRFPEMVVSKRKSSPERIIYYLDLYESISELYPEIESLFSYKTTASVTSQARSSLEKVGEFIRSSLAEFESAIQKESSKEIVPGGGYHPITRYVMNYLCLHADYSEILADILSKDHPVHAQKPLPEPFVELLSPVTSTPSSPSRYSSDETHISALSSRVAWVTLLLLCKIDRKAEMYKDPALSYLFLANNVRYMVNKVRTSNLRHLLGPEWVTKSGEKAQAFARGYERLAWKKVIDAIPEAGKGSLENMEEFNSAFEEAYRRQSGWVVTDKWLRDEIKISIAGKVMVPYRELYMRCMATLRVERDAAAAGVIKFSPDDIGNYLSDLFYGVPPGSPSESSRSSGSGPPSASAYSSGAGSNSWSSKLVKWRSV